MNTNGKEIKAITATLKSIEAYGNDTPTVRVNDVDSKDGKAYVQIIGSPIKGYELVVDIHRLTNVSVDYTDGSHVFLGDSQRNQRPIYLVAGSRTAVL